MVMLAQNRADNLDKDLPIFGHKVNWRFTGQRTHPDGLKVKSRVRVGLSSTRTPVFGVTSWLAVTRPEPRISALDAR
jgi:hypothetical protein